MIDPNEVDFWYTADGRVIPINEMEATHLYNALRSLLKSAYQQWYSAQERYYSAETKRDLDETFLRHFVEIPIVHALCVASVGKSLPRAHADKRSGKVRIVNERPEEIAHGSF